MTEATVIYRAVMVEVERRRLQIGWPMWKLDDAAGTQDGYYGKALYADTKSGRQCRWETLDLYMGALFPDGFDIAIRAKKSPSLDATRHRSKIRSAAAYTSTKSLRDHMGELGKIGGKKGGEARAKNQGKRKLRAIGKLGAKARWSKPTLTEITDAAPTATVRRISSI